MTSYPLSRRSLLAAGAIGLAMPRPAFSQATEPETVEGETSMRLRFTFADQDFTVTLEDNPTARDLLSMLPLELTISDHSSNEKIAFLPERLTEAGAGPINSPAPGDICYFGPWGNLAMYHGEYGNYPRLIRLGKMDQGPAPLLVRGEFPLRIEHIS